MSIFSRNYVQGRFVPKHTEKCVNMNGTLGSPSVPTYRSSWELKFMKFCDKYDSVLEWGSEVVKIPYISEVDGKAHQYITDFYFVCRDACDRITRYIIEVKPKSQVANLDENFHIVYPDPPKTRTRKAIENWQERCNTLRVNNSKWTAARKWCATNGFVFKILTEEQILEKFK